MKHHCFQIQNYALLFFSNFLSSRDFRTFQKFLISGSCLVSCVTNAFLKSALYAPECQLSLVGSVTGSVMISLV